MAREFHGIPWCLTKKSMSEELFQAIEAHDVTWVANQLSAGADPNAALMTAPYWRPLGAAIEQDYHDAPAHVVLEIVKLLVQHGADVNAWDHERRLNPFLSAVYWKNCEVAALLLAIGSDPNVINCDNETALLMAAELDDCEMARIILDHGGGARIDAPGGLISLTPLGHAAQNVSLPMIKLLLSAGADIYAADVDGIPRNYLRLKNAPSAEALDEAFALLSVGMADPTNRTHQSP